MDEFIGTVKTMREEVKDLNLPPEMLEKRISAMIEQYKQQAMNSKGAQVSPEMAGAMSGVVQDPMGQPIPNPSMIEPSNNQQGVM